MLTKPKSDRSTKVENDPVLMSAMNDKRGYTIKEIVLGIFTFSLLAATGFLLFNIIFG